jgi:uncharacterized protein YkwD
MSKTKHICVKPIVNSYKRGTLLWVLFFVFTETAFTQPAEYIKSIEPYFASPTAFPDSMYAGFNWNEFEQWDAAMQPVSLQAPDYNLLNAAIFYHTNLYRQKMKKHPLQFKSELRDAAMYHSIQMSDKGFYNHINPQNKKMREPMQRIRMFGTEANYYAENINKTFALDYKEFKTYDKDAVGYYYTLQTKEYIPTLTYNELAKRIVKGWIDSKPHRENMLGVHVTHFGCGAVLDKKSLAGRNMPEINATQNFVGGIITDLYNLR